VTNMTVSPFDASYRKTRLLHANFMGLYNVL